ncbi:hypothetical protein PILCRDRAFT_625263 [Piloderma croceum F 1598]|uniref:Uncharacterized protein n=1 Tax=Piloderma croceum (strain F 1598) TaxID=765440 RepID=A0A0C3BIN8_PILCF|nr:hypothetical protein PILCRDRAFT_625263 [Piloderma croceum F 1598]
MGPINIRPTQRNPWNQVKIATVFLDNAAMCVWGPTWHSPLRIESSSVLPTATPDIKGSFVPRTSRSNKITERDTEFNGVKGIAT